MAACSHRNIPNNDEFCIVIRQNAKHAIYGVHYEYSLAGFPIGGAEVVIRKSGTVIPIELGKEFVWCLIDK